MRHCPFTGNEDFPCPVPPDYPEYHLMAPCAPEDSSEENTYGVNCATIMSQKAIVDEFNPETRKIKLDEVYGLINAHVRVTEVPEGPAPYDLRSQIQYLWFPLRVNRPEDGDTVAVSHPDLILTLLKADMLKAANWFNQHRQELIGDEELLWWQFNASDVDHGTYEWPADSVREYDLSYYRTKAAFWNSPIPPFQLLRLMIDGKDAAQTIPTGENLLRLLRKHKRRYGHQKSVDPL